MSGKRTKALRREFRKTFGRGPLLSRIRERRGGSGKRMYTVTVTCNEFRRYKRARIRAMQAAA